MPEVVYTVARFGFLLLIWLFVFVVMRSIRRDVFAGNRGGGIAAPGAVGPPAGPGNRPQHGADRVAHQLVVTEGELAGRRIRLTNAPIFIGRAHDSTLVITDDFASARHARLSPMGGQWVLEDLGSTNGTYLGRAKVTGPTPVPLGVPIRIGRTCIELRS